MNRKEINRYIRKISNKDSNKKCYICKSDKDIENHHIFLVEDLTRIAYHNGYDNEEDLNKLYIPTKNLCSKHHKLVHQLNENNFENENVSLDELIGICNLLNEVDFNKIPEELLQDYVEIYDNMIENIIFNFVKNNDLSDDEFETACNIIKNNLSCEFLEKGDEEDEGLD